MKPFCLSSIRRPTQVLNHLILQIAVVAAAALCGNRPLRRSQDRTSRFEQPSDLYYLPCLPPGDVMVTGPLTVESRITGVASPNCMTVGPSQVRTACWH